MSAPVGFVVAERRGGKWLFGPDWSAQFEDRADAEVEARAWRESLARYGVPDEDVAVFALVPAGEVSL